MNTDDKKLKVLIYGGGAREHTLAWKISQSPMLEKLYLYKPNDGFAALGEVVRADNFTELANTAKELSIDILVVGPEEPLVKGITDVFKKVSIPVIGPTADWAALEGSKSFAKEFMVRNNIPTAQYAIITDKSQICSVLSGFSSPIVLKADGIAAGKGVSIVNSRAEAEIVLEGFLGGKFGEASKKVVVEEFLDGEELSLISLWDGDTLLPLIPARDYKRLLDNDLGPNTGGMGAYCPVELTSEQQELLDDYLVLLETALKAEKADFAGIVYSGLMWTNGEFKVLEYNMRFGDPETQPLLTHMDSDLLEIFLLMTKKELNKAHLEWGQNMSGCVVIAAVGYPESPVAGGIIENTSEIESKYGVKVFFAGVKGDSQHLRASGGRVLSIVKSGEDPFNDIYEAAKSLKYSDKHYRNDIGKVKNRV